MADDDQDPRSSSGGAAANAGVEFQQRVAAWCLVMMHCKADPKALMDLPETGPISAVRFETQLPIDDLVLLTEKAGHVFVQAKRKVSLSETAESDFVSTLQQFVNQFVARPNSGYYVLAVPNDASATIRNTFRKLLDQLRANSDAWTANPLSRSGERCLATYRAVVEKLFKIRTGTDLDEATIVAFSRRVFVREFAVATGMGHEIAALTLLGRDAKVPPELVWSHLIASSLALAARRASITRDNLADLIGRYFHPSEMATPESVIKLAIKTSGTLPAGREVVVIKDFPNENDLSVLEFYRFDAAGSKRLRFKGDRLFWNGGTSGSPILHRSATTGGMDRWIDRHKSTFAERSVHIIPAHNIEAEVHSAAAQAHAALLETMLNENQQLMMCLHCGKPVSQTLVTLVEIDDDDSPHAVGVVHDECLRPLDRVIGQLQCPMFEGREYLKKFDINRWIALRLHGQGTFNDRVDANLGGPAILGWNRRNERYRENSYCIEVLLSDGTSRHVTSRGSLDRFDLEEATRQATSFNSHFRTAAAAGDPACYTSVNFRYGMESLLLRLKEPEEILLECREARVVPYTVALGRRYQRDSMFYAPLCRFVRADNEKPVLVHERQLVLTDPLRLNELIKNCQNAGIQLPDYEIRILETDNDVDRWFADLFADGEEPIIDPVYDRAGNLVGGYLVVDLSEVTTHEDRLSN